ncbi:MAG: VanZ family protein [Clostridia bacterium]|nr:VanZ family protein [Clostridia bacterium]
MDKVTFFSGVVLAMVLALPVVSHLLRRYPRLLSFINYLLLAVYLFANIYLTMLSRPVRMYHHMELTPFWSYAAWAQGDAELREEVILNILLYVPLGYLMHHAFPRLKWWLVILSGFALSALTEAVQLVCKLGLCEIDDLISNTLGTVIGVGAYMLYKRLERRKQDQP